MNYKSVLNLSIFVYSTIFNMFWPVLGYHQGNHSYTTLWSTGFTYVSHTC